MLRYSQCLPRCSQIKTKSEVPRCCWHGALLLIIKIISVAHYWLPPGPTAAQHARWCDGSGAPPPPAPAAHEAPRHPTTPATRCGDPNNSDGAVRSAAAAAAASSSRTRRRGEQPAQPFSSPAPPRLIATKKKARRTRGSMERRRRISERVQER